MRGPVLAGVLAVAMAGGAAGSAAAETVRLKSAGSLKPAFTRLVAEFSATSGVGVQMEFGGSGTLRDKILAGDPTDVFTSANMEHPQAVAQARGGTVQPFARNSLCALMQPGMDTAPEHLLQTLLDPSTRVGTSTPKADPAGDYAFALFDRAEALQPGAGETLKKKARQLTGAPDSRKPPEGRNAYGYWMEQKAADVFLTYCTNARVAAAEVPGLLIGEVPENLAVGAEYGLIVTSSSAGARKLADYILSSDGQAVLRDAGFAAASR